MNRVCVCRIVAESYGIDTKSTRYATDGKRVFLIRYVGYDLVEVIK